ncbi:Na+/H+ antiporter NhaA [Gynuella sunshinyii]|uniref:Na(+)/H(+) antiporter NhaA n=1 Tax=Gynuella sunshinyii YC6258 TaxID=1445510 RepID=A0A0C5VGI5_9GAMM|nr:Na+/H+ antiporter NhaA [Gynuella sunshinyii]AJQ93286.1 Na+/H+ antiporter [Gynuella sunshinyii YC6258]
MFKKTVSLAERFFALESAGGLLLVGSAILAMLLANSPITAYYDLLIDTPVVLQIGALEVAKPLLLWVNDGLMAIFFLHVGLELKRELLDGQLSGPGQIVLPLAGAIGGMAVPALFYTAFNFNDPVAMQGWAIPAATDIAFSLGILSLLGTRVPTSLKLFLTSLAIFDDVGAIIIIAIFYSAHISMTSLLIVAVCIALLWLLNSNDVMAKTPYLIVGMIMWVATLKSGVHATLAGVVLALFIPLKNPDPSQPSPLKELEHELHSFVSFFILPFFAFCNSGIQLTGLTMQQVVQGIPAGIASGLFLGKQIGVMGFCWLAIKLKLAKLPDQVHWGSFWGVAILCGIGFTMSLFISSLAFEDGGSIQVIDRLGIVIGSLLSGVTGYLVLKYSLKDKPSS